MNLSYYNLEIFNRGLRRAYNCLFLLFCICSQSSCRRDPIIYMCYGSYPSSRIASSDTIEDYTQEEILLGRFNIMQENLLYNQGILLSL
jgi:hypothetical protein